MTQLIYTANTCNFYFHLTLRKSVTNGQRTDSGQRTNSTVYRVAAQLISKFPSDSIPNKAVGEPSNDVIGPGLQVVCLQYVNISELFH